MSKVVLDASAVLAYLNNEKGAARVEAYLGDALISTVNLTEVIGILMNRGLELDETLESIHRLGLDVKPFTQAQAINAGALLPATRALGLSLGDRACVSLGQSERLPVLTSDRQWAKLQLDIEIELIR